MEIADGVCQDWGAPQELAVRKHTLYAQMLQVQVATNGINSTTNGTVATLPRGAGAAVSASTPTCMKTTNGHSCGAIDAGVPADSLVRRLQSQFIRLEAALHEKGVVAEGSDAESVGGILSDIRASLGIANCVVTSNVLADAAV